MSVKSLPSKPIQFFDLPEVINLTADFFYNFFIADEQINEQGRKIADGNLSQRISRAGEKNLSSRVPRFVKLEYRVRDTKKKAFFGLIIPIGISLTLVVLGFAESISLSIYRLKAIAPDRANSIQSTICINVTHLNS